VQLPHNAHRIDLPTNISRVLTRVALGTDVEGAVKYQHQFKMKATGKPKLPDIPITPIFELETFPGLGAFEAAHAAIDSDPDRNPGLETLQTQTLAIADAMKGNMEERQRVEKIIKDRAFPEIGKAAAIIGHGVTHNGWTRPGVVGEYGIDYLTRTLVNYRGIWANVKPEVLYYRGGSDADGEELNGDHSYTLTFAKDALPSRFAKYFWSIIAVDSFRFRVLPNPTERYLLNEATKPQLSADGSLTLYFSADKPADAPDGNWLPTPKGAKYRLTMRFYGPIDGVSNGTYWPPALVKSK
jgi:hypothetical protein